MGGGQKWWLAFDRFHDPFGSPPPTPTSAFWVCLTSFHFPSINFEEGSCKGALNVLWVHSGLCYLGYVTGMSSEGIQMLSELTGKPPCGFHRWGASSAMPFILPPHRGAGKWVWKVFKCFWAYLQLMLLWKHNTRKLEKHKNAFCAHLWGPLSLLGAGGSKKQILCRSILSSHTKQTITWKDHQESLVCGVHFPGSCPSQDGENGAIGISVEFQFSWNMPISFIVTLVVVIVIFLNISEVGVKNLVS